MQVQNLNNSVYPNQSQAASNFKAKPLDPRIIESLSKDGTRMSRFLSYAGENQGEALNILVTAFGTAVVCPMFIRFNPFSKEDKNTRAYSAWRQPISAIIAVAAQLSITKWFNNHLAKKASTSNKKGEANYKRADLRACPHERHLTRIVKLEHPDWDKKQVKAEVKRLQLVAEKEVIAEARDKMKNTPIEIKDLICQEYLDNAEKEYVKGFRDLHTQNVTKKLDKFGEKAESSLSGASLDKYKELSKKVRAWIPDPNKKEYEKLEKEIVDILPENLRKEFKEIGKEINITPKQFKKMVDAKFLVLAEELGVDKAALIRKTAEEMVEKDVLSEAVIKTAIRDMQSHHISIDKATEMCTKENVLELIAKKGLTDKLGGGDCAEEIAQEVIRKLEIQRGYEESKKMADFASVKDLGKTFDEILHNVKIKKLIKSRTSDAKKVFKTMNTQLGLVVTLLTLPITCGILNWAYPRIMEYIMPEMAAKKKAASNEPVKKEGGDK